MLVTTGKPECAELQADSSVTEECCRTGGMQLGTMLLPEGLAGRGILFSFSQLTGGLPGPVLAVWALSGTVGACGVIGVVPWEPEPPPTSPRGGWHWVAKAGPAAGAGTKRFSLFLLSKEFYMCIQKKKPQTRP